MEESERADYDWQTYQGLEYSEWEELLPEIIDSRPEDVSYTNSPDPTLKFRHKSCTQKIKFPSEERVKEELHSGMHIYHCRFCGFWHMGHGDKVYADVGEPRKPTKKKKRGKHSRK